MISRLPLRPLVGAGRTRAFATFGADAASRLGASNPSWPLALSRTTKSRIDGDAAQTSHLAPLSTVPVTRWFSSTAKACKNQVSDDVGGVQLTEPADGTNGSVEPKRDDEMTANVKDVPEDAPAYQMSFTCKQCDTRSTHRVTKQGYHHGTVLVKCPGCKNRHLISDHLKIFSDERITIEDILSRKGETVLKRTVQPGDDDIEIWQ